MTATRTPLDSDTPDKDSLRQIGRKVRQRLAGNKAVRKIDVAGAELWAVGNFLDAIECGRLIALIDAVAKPSQAYDIDYSTGFRTSYSGDLNPLDAFVRTLQQRLDDLLGMDPANSETIQGQRYAEGQEFKPHNDWFQPGGAVWEREKGRGGQRAITAMGFLNRVEEGGETDFPALDIAIRPHPGTLLIWNNADEEGVPNPLTVHAGNPVRRGVKYIFTKWYRCRRWL